MLKNAKKFLTKEESERGEFRFRLKPGVFIPADAIMANLVPKSSFLNFRGSAWESLTLSHFTGFKSIAPEE